MDTVSNVKFFNDRRFTGGRFGSVGVSLVAVPLVAVSRVNVAVEHTISSTLTHTGHEAKTSNPTRRNMVDRVATRVKVSFYLYRRQQ